MESLEKNNTEKNISLQEIIEKMKERFYYGYIKTIYPIDAMELNSDIMINLIKKECM